MKRERERENGWVSPKSSSPLSSTPMKGREREREKPSRHTRNGIRFLSPLPHSYCDKFVVGNFPLSLRKPVMGLHSSLLTHNGNNKKMIQHLHPLPPKKKKNLGPLGCMAPYLIGCKDFYFIFLPTCVLYYIMGDDQLT